MALTRRKKIILAVAIVIVALVFVIVPAGIAWASVHPSRCGYDDTPSTVGLAYTSFNVTTEDGVVLKGWEIEPSNSERSAVIILMHGYTSCKADPRLLNVSKALSLMGYRVVTFDFRAHGESGGDKTTIGPLEARYDAPAVIDYVAAKYPDRPIVLMGYSMGAVVAIMAGAEDPRVTAVVADSPYPVLDTVIPRWLKSQMGVPEAYSKLIGFWGARFTGESLSYGPMLLDEIDKPLLVIVGTRDPLVTPDEAREIAAKSCCGDAVIVDGAGHVEAAKVMGEAYFIRVMGFIEQYTSPQAQACAALAPTNPPLMARR